MHCHYERKRSNPLYLDCHASLAKSGQSPRSARTLCVPHGNDNIFKSSLRGRSLRLANGTQSEVGQSQVIQIGNDAFSDNKGF